MNSSKADAFASKRVQRRHVFFVGGFDPKGASWYHALYSRHAALQSAVNGMTIDVGRRQRDEQGRAYWTTHSSSASGEQCSARIECVAWDATVRRHWPRTGWGLLRDMGRAYARMFRHGTGQIFKVYRIAPKTAFALLYPLLLFVAFAIAGAVAMLASALWIASLSGSVLPGLLTAVLTGCLVGVAALRIEKRLDTSLLARIFAFVGEYATAGLPEIDHTLADAASRITELVRQRQTDEILVVGYSVGSILASRIMAMALTGIEREPGDQPALALLTLGNCVPLYGLYPQAGAYREELASLGQSERMSWVDVSSPSDWGSFPLLNPLEVCGVSVTHQGLGWPRMTSPRFHTVFSAPRYRAMRRNKHAMHTQYLMSAELPGGYDYFAITAGPQFLHLRYSKPKVRRT